MNRIFGIVALCFCLAGGAQAQAPSAGAVAIELNKLEQVDQACRVYLVIRTDGAEPLARAALDLVLFDKSGVILKRLAYDVGPIAATKTVVKLFDSVETECARVGEILINAVTACEAADGPREGCIERFTPSSRAGAAFTK